MFKRIFRSFVKLIGVLAIGFSVFLGIIFWRLNVGPISLSFLTPYFESAFKFSDNRFEIKLQDTNLSWVQKDQNLSIKLHGIRAVSAGGQVIAMIPELAISLSGEALLKGELGLKNITIFGPSLNIVRTKFGKLELGVTNFVGDNEDGQAINKNLIDGIIGQLLSPIDISQSLGYLRQIDIISADVMIDDRQFGGKWRAPETDLVLTKKEGKVSVSAELDLKSSDSLVSETAAINLRGYYDIDKSVARVTVGFSDLNPAVVSPLFSEFTALKHFNLPLSGDVDLVITKSGEINKFKFDMSSGRGQIVFSEPTRASVIVEEMKFLGQYDKAAQRLQIENLTLNLDKDGALKLPVPFNHEWPGRKISLSGDYDFDFNRLTVEKVNFFTKELTVTASATIQKFNDKISFELDGKSSDLSINQILTVWPKELAAPAREWTTESLVSGIIPSVKVNITGHYSQTNGFAVSTIQGVLDYENMTVNYLTPMPKITDGKGKIKFDGDNVDIEIMNGKSGGLLIRNGHVTLTDLDKVDQHADVQLEIDGSLGSIIKIADSKPFRLVKSIGFAPGLIKGDFTSKINLNFLLERNLTLDKIKVSTEAVLKKVSIPKIGLDLNLTNGNLILTADNESMSIKGTGQLSGVETEVEWHENFINMGQYRRKYRLKATVGDRSWREKLKLNFPPFNKTYTNGLIGADVSVKVSEDGSGELEANLDLKDTLITLPRMGWYKPKKVAASAFIAAAFLRDEFKSISMINYKGGGLNLNANASFKNDGALNQVVINRINFGQTDIKAILAPHSDPENEGWNIHVSGKELDLIEWMASEDLVAEKVRGMPLTFHLNLDAIKLYPNKSLMDVNGIISFDGLVWKAADIKSGRGVNKALDITLIPKNGKRSLRIKAKNAGSILKIFDYYDNLIGGQLYLRGEYDGMLPESKFSGRAKIDDFRVINAPILANLLNVASITGIVDELLGGVGIGFSRLDAPFESRKDIIIVKDASVSGLSLGMTATGKINSKLETVNLKGTIVPAYMLNTALTRIPIIGAILSGGEKYGGVFAANYTMTGNPKDPDISTNPLSVLAPGFLRQLFRIFDEPIKELTTN